MVEGCGFDWLGLMWLGLLGLWLELCVFWDLILVEFLVMIG